VDVNADVREVPLVDVVVDSSIVVVVVVVVQEFTT